MRLQRLRCAVAAVICIGARPSLARGSGVGTYSDVLVAALRGQGEPPLLVDEGSVHHGRAWRWARALRWWPRRMRRSAEALTLRDLYREAQVYFDVRGTTMPLSVPGETGIVHWTYPMPLRLVGWKNIYTVHDAIPLTRPDLSPIDSDRHRRMLASIFARADRIATVSESAKRDIVAAIECDPALIANVGQAFDVTFEATPRTSGLADRGYFIVCGSLEPRKNIERLLAAYRASGAALPLIVVGAKGWRGDGIAAAIARTPGARWIGFVPRDALLRLIAGARALLFPSLAEGFGLPLLEAMALGTPAMIAAIPALEEVACGIALAADPLDVEAMADAIRRLAVDDALLAALRERGLRRARDFSLDAFATRVLALYAAVEHGQ